MLLYDYEASTVEMSLKKLKDILGWCTNPMLKRHLKILKELGYICYPDEVDSGELKPNQKVKIHIVKISELNEWFKEITEKSIRENIIPATNKPEKAVRFCFLIKHYTNMEYGYCWLTYEQIQNWGNIRHQEINELIITLEKAKLLYVTRGNVIKDTQDRIRKENNKYQLLFR